MRKLKKRPTFKEWAAVLKLMAKHRARDAQPLAPPLPMEPSERAVIAYERATRRCAERWE